ncbi:peptidyl-prolyl cis-trans isomerase FKBP16-1, chloroplastic [Andrographis paniculata]|uniref:peptidyl-prolyl cis-trans isomerase FKBP16-1, chloroplastic n=1 Tax=Andrographis paniculata TaxID=175694 RepID=UPI0021E7E1CD|nr:peptidyl-prolyl cis-trans isomerase FKBP16-1, chloroplastic [Andrographis paniculata]
MESAAAFQIRFLQSPLLLARKHEKLSKVSAIKGLEDEHPNKVLRREVFGLMGFSIILTNVCPVLAASMMPEMKDPDVLRTFKLPSGVRIQDIVDGQGQEAHEGDTVRFNYVCRRSNGYFVHSTINQFSGESSPVTLPLDDQQMIKGLKEVLIGMKVGGKRRALIPPSVGYTSEALEPIPQEFGPRRSLLSHMMEPLIFEVQLLKIV